MTEVQKVRGLRTDLVLCEPRKHECMKPDTCTRNDLIGVVMTSHEWELLDLMATLGSLTIMINGELQDGNQAGAQETVQLIYGCVDTIKRITEGPEEMHSTIRKFYDLYDAPYPEHQEEVASDH